MTYGVSRLWEEITYLGYYLHWPCGELLDLDHRARMTVIGEVGRIHERLDQDAGVPPQPRQH